MDNKHTFLTSEILKALKSTEAVVALIDADIPAYSVAFMCEDVDSWPLVEKQVDNFMSKRIQESGANYYIGFLTNGGKNFRLDVATTIPYKGNRAGQEKPRWFSEVRQYLEKSWGCQVMQGIEADDALTIAQTYFNSVGIPCVLCSLDKDLLQSPGSHWNWKHQERTEIDEYMGQLLLWRQVITGDMVTDNIPGLSHSASVPPLGYRVPVFETYMKVPSEPKMLKSGKPSTRKMAHARQIGWEVIDDPRKNKPLAEFLYGKTKAEEMLPYGTPEEDMASIVLNAYVDAYWEDGEALGYDDPAQRGIERFNEVFDLIYMLRTVDEIPNAAVIDFTPKEFRLRFLNEFDEEDIDDFTDTDGDF